MQQKKALWIGVDLRLGVDVQSCLRYAGRYQKQRKNKRNFKTKPFEFHNPSPFEGTTEILPHAPRGPRKAPGPPGGQLLPCYCSFLSRPCPTQLGPTISGRKR